MLSQTLPPRLTWRVGGRSAAAVFPVGARAGSRAWQSGGPESAEGGTRGGAAAAGTGATRATRPWGRCRAVAACRCRCPPLACGRRFLLSGPAPGGCLPDGDDVALVDPDLDTDAPEGGPGLGEAVVDVRPERVQRDLALVVALTAAHLGATEAAGARDLHALGPRLDRGVDRFAHRPPKRQPGRQLLGHGLGQEL